MLIGNRVRLQIRNRSLRQLLHRVICSNPQGIFAAHAVFYLHLSYRFSRFRFYRFPNSTNSLRVYVELYNLFIAHR